MTPLRTLLDQHEGAVLMGILNRTPDSFSDGGRFVDDDAALAHVDAMVRAGATIIDLIVHSGLENSKGAARKSVEAGGIYLNNIRVAEATRTVTTADLLFGQHLLLRKGKKSYAVLRVT